LTMLSATVAVASERHGSAVAHLIHAEKLSRRPEFAHHRSNYEEDAPKLMSCIADDLTKAEETIVELRAKLVGLGADLGRVQIDPDEMLDVLIKSKKGNTDD